jgi:hypothetical protein
MPLPPCGRIKAVRPTNSCEHAPGETRSFAKQPTQAFGLTDGSRTHGKAGGASLCAHASGLRDAGTHLIFSGKTQPQLNAAG